jgi:hypothetical protein
MPLACSRAVLRPDRLLMTLLLGVVLAGGHLGLLRMVAWSSMLIDRCSSQPLAVAISTTFDGEHPCRLCEEISRHDGDQDADQDQPTITVKIAKIIGLITDRWLQPPTNVVAGRFLVPEARLGVGITLQPPVPPPRYS